MNDQSEFSLCPTQRNSFDNELNSHGKRLLEICKSADLRILNGRVSGDSLGGVTFHGKNGVSVVDTKAEEGLQTSDFSLQTSDFRLQTSDFRLRTSDFRLQTSDLTKFELRILISDHSISMLHGLLLCKFFTQ